MNTKLVALFSQNLMDKMRVISVIIFFMATAAVQAARTYNVANGNVIIGSNGDYVITGASSANRISVRPGVRANIVISNLRVTSSARAFAIAANATVQLTLRGDNSLQSGAIYAGLHMHQSAKLVMAANSTGSLVAQGSAGIGGSSELMNGGGGGTITINGGTITATGSRGAGVGGGYGLDAGGGGGTITINGGTVTATGNTGIGGGAGGDGKGGAGGKIIINGGTVMATGNCGAGIGGGFGYGGGRGGNGGTITINGGTVTAIGEMGAGIGGGCNEEIGSGGGGTITINGGTVTATGEMGAGIGGGDVDGVGGTITINGGMVTATGGSQVSATPLALGPGYHGGPGTLAIAPGATISAGTSAGDAIVVTTYQGEKYGNIWFPGHDVYEHDNSASTAKTIKNGKTQRRSIHLAGDEDWAKFRVGSAGARNVRLVTSGTQGDTQMWLYNSAGTRLRYDDNSGVGNFSKITRPSLSRGTYYIKIREYGNNGQIAAYKLKASWSSP